MCQAFSQHVLQLVGSHQKNAGTKEVVLSNANTFLRQNGFRPEDEVDAKLIEKIELALRSGPQNTEGVQLGNLADTSRQARIRSLVTGYHELTGARFTQLLNESISKSALTMEAIGKASSISVGTLNLLKYNKCYHKIPPKSIEALDQILTAQGVLAAAYNAIIRGGRFLNCSRHWPVRNRSASYWEQHARRKDLPRRNLHKLPISLCPNIGTGSTIFR
jgi:hypothetical protein